MMPGAAKLSGQILTVMGAGLVTVRASQGGNAFYAPASDVDGAFMVGGGLNRITEFGQAADVGSTSPLSASLAARM